MTAEPAAPRGTEHPAAGPRPTLSVIRNCERCGQRVVVARDRDNCPRMLLIGDGGRAIRDPDGELWAAVLNGRWCVVTVAAGEEPPASGKGARYTEHRCPQVSDPPPTAGRSGRPRGGLSGSETAAKGVTLHEFVLGVVRRPAGRGEGGSGPPCPERNRQPQFTPGGGAPYSRLCIRCGKITCRSDGDLLPWCGGGLVRFDQL